MKKVYIIIVILIFVGAGFALALIDKNTTNSAIPIRNDTTGVVE